MAPRGISARATVVRAKSSREIRDALGLKWSKKPPHIPGAPDSTFGTYNTGDATTRQYGSSPWKNAALGRDRYVDMLAPTSGSSND